MQQVNITIIVWNTARHDKGSIWKIITFHLELYTRYFEKDDHTKAGIKLEFIISSRFHVLISKLTKKTAKNLAKKSIEKGVSTAIESVGEIATQKLVKKFSQKPAEENKGKLISELLHS